MSIEIRKDALTSRFTGASSIPGGKRKDRLSEEEVDVLLSQLPEEEQYIRLITIPGKKFKSIG